MKVKELSNISHVNMETIRMYRKKGMLVPKQNQENNYYEYTMEDFLNLLYIRKLRGSNLSLDTILYTYTHSDLSDVLDGYEKELVQIDEQIRELEKRRFILQITLEHLEEYKENMAGVSLIESYDDKYDCYFEKSSDPVISSWIDKIELFTQTIGISKETLLQDELPEQVPIRIGIGSYRNILVQNNMPIPEGTVICPKGKYVTAHVELERLDVISRDQLTPLLDYVKEHGYIIDSDTTAFLFRIDYSGDKPKFIYRIRVKVK